MTISTTGNEIVHVSSGITAAYAFPFPFTTAADLKVALNGVLQTVGYTVTGTVPSSGSGTFASGTVTFAVAPAANVQVYIYCEPDLLQATSLPPNDPFPAKTVEKMADKLTLLEQRARAILNRCLQFRAPLASGISNLLPIPEAGKLLGWTAQGTALQNMDASSLASIVAFGTMRADKFTAIEGQTVFTLSSNPGPVANIDLSVDGLTYVPDVDFFVYGLDLTLAVGVAAGSEICARYGQALPQADSTTAIQLKLDLASSADAVRGAGLVAWDNSRSYAAGSVGAKLLRTAIDLDDMPGATDWDKLSAGAALCKASGRALRIPARRVDVDTSRGSITLQEITIIGEQVLDGSNATVDAGAVFWITGTVNSPFLIRRGVTIDGVGFYYPSQTDSATPTVYPYTLDFDYTAALPFVGGAVQFVYIQNCVVFNAYNFCRMDDAGGGVGHVWITNNTICALNRAIFCRYNAEVIRIIGNSFTFGHWVISTEAGARAFYRANSVALECPKTDGMFIAHNLFFGQLRALQFAATGVCTLLRISGNSFDQSRFGIYAVGSGNFAGVIDGANDFYCFNSQSTASQANAIRIDTTGVTVREQIVIGTNYFVLATEDMVYVGGTAPRDLVVGPSAYANWAAYKSSGTYAAFNLNTASGTNVSISGGTMNGATYSAYASGIIGSCNALTVNGVTFNACKQPLSITSNLITGSGNASYATVAAASDVVSATTLTWGPNSFDKPSLKTPLALPIGTVRPNANDAAAAADGIPIGGFYRNGSVVQVRVT